MSTLTKRSVLDAFQYFAEQQKNSALLNKACREESVQRLEQMSIPSRKDEAWKYTPTAPILKHEWKPALMSNIDEQTTNIDLPEMDAFHIWIVDGYVHDIPSEVGANIQLMSTASAFEKGLVEKERMKDDGPFQMLNSVLCQDGVYLKVGRKCSPKRPIHIVHVQSQDNTAVFTRNIIELDTCAEAHLIQSHIHLKKGQMHSNCVSDIHIADGARLVLEKTQSGTETSYHYSSERVSQGKDCSYTCNTATLSGAWTRNDPKVVLLGQHSISHLNGAYIPSGRELIDNHTVIDHRVPNCESHELYKGVIHAQGEGVFNGKVFVRPDAQKTNAFQQNANILMTEEGSMNSKPELEIYADDVKCSHGSTTGQLDQEALFYLQCRGLSRQSARQMLVQAFIGEVLEKFSQKDLVNWVEGHMRGKS